MTNGHPTYEFSQDQNQIIERLAHYMGVVGVVALLLGGLSALGTLGVFVAAAKTNEPQGYGQALGMLVNVIYYLGMGILVRKAAESFRRVVRTHGNDIDHLMEALDNLRTAFKVLYVLIIIALVIFGAAFLIGMLAAAGAAR